MFSNIKGDTIDPIDIVYTIIFRRTLWIIRKKMYLFNEKLIKYYTKTIALWINTLKIMTKRYLVE